METGNLAIVLILTVGFGFASLLGYLARRVKMPATLGYLIAGYLIGPYSPGFVGDIKLAEQLAEIGVILMLFGVGLHFKLQDLIDVKDIALPGAAGQTLVATLVTMLIVMGLGWNFEAGLIMGLSVGVASTVVLVRVLTDNHLLKTREGHIAVGWLVVEDIITVVILILLPTIAALTQGTQIFVWPIFISLILFAIGKFIVLGFFMFTWGHKIVEYILINVARIRSPELFILTVLALLFSIAMGSALIFGTSLALGAFIAGMVIGKTSVRHQAAANSLPFKDIFAVVFFLSVGMLFNPEAIMANLNLFLGITFVILIVKPITAYLITRFLGYSFKEALTVGLSLAQIGEFSFILSVQAMDLKLLPEEGFDILVACALVSISINPLFFPVIEYLEKNKSKFRFLSHAPTVNPPPNMDVTQQKVIIVGLGPIGRAVADLASNSGYTPIIIENNIDTVSDLEENFEILFGDASEAVILKEAHIEEAFNLVITIPDTEKTLAIIDAARLVNPNIEIIARVRYMGEQPLMDDVKVRYICSERASLKEFVEQMRGILQPESPIS